MAVLSRRIGLLDTENAFKIGPKIRALEDQGKKVIKCNLGEPDFPLPTFIKEEVKRQLDLDNTHYCAPQGLLTLRRAVAVHFASTRGIPADPQRVVVFPGAKPPIGMSQEAYCNPGDEVIYPSPGFPIYESFTRYVEAKPVPVHLKEEAGFTLSADDISARLSPRTKLIILNFPSNPTGGVATKEQLEGIARVILEKCPPDVRVYSDEVYEHILFDGARHHSIASFPGMEKRTIVVGGASKSYSWTGGRIGWALFPTVEEAEIFKNLNINYFSCVPAYNQEGSRLALESPLAPEAIREMNRAFQERRDVVLDGLSRIPGIRCSKPAGAFYLFPNVSGACERLGVFDAYKTLPADLRKLTTPSTLLQMFLLFEYQVATMDRKSFGRIGADDMHYLRLSIATNLKSLKEAVERISQAAQDVKGFAKFVKAGQNLY